MKKNPFSLYDFLGYVFPGAIAIYILYFLISYGEDKSKGVESLQLSLEDSILWIICAYVVGHLIAYLSSLFVEIYAINLFNYPSSYLLKKSKRWNYWSIDDKETSKYQKSVIIIWRIFVGLFLLPVTIGYLITGKMLGAKTFFVKRLDDSMIIAINDSRIKLEKFLEVKLNSEGDWHRIVYHYEYEKNSAHAIKMDNYVALYGFLRALTFIFNCLFMWLLCIVAIPTINFKNGVDWNLIWIIVSLGLVTYVFFMAFIKFYRRFTLESLMSLVTDVSYKHKSTQDS